MSLIGVDTIILFIVILCVIGFMAFLAVKHYSFKKTEDQFKKITNNEIKALKDMDSKINTLHNELSDKNASDHSISKSLIEREEERAKNAERLNNEFIKENQVIFDDANARFNDFMNGVVNQATENQELFNDINDRMKDNYIYIDKEKNVRLDVEKLSDGVESGNLQMVSTGLNKKIKINGFGSIQIDAKNSSDRAKKCLKLRGNDICGSADESIELKANKIKIGVNNNPNNPPEISINGNIVTDVNINNGKTLQIGGIDILSEINTIKDKLTPGTSNYILRPPDLVEGFKNNGQVDVFDMINDINSRLNKLNNDITNSQKVIDNSMKIIDKKANTKAGKIYVDNARKGLEYNLTRNLNNNVTTLNKKLHDLELKIRKEYIDAITTQINMVNKTNGDQNTNIANIAANLDRVKTKLNQLSMNTFGYNVL